MRQRVCYSEKERASQSEREKGRINERAVVSQVREDGWIATRRAVVVTGVTKLE